MADLVPIAPTRSQGLVDVLDRILDKGLVVAGDIKVNLANVELLTIQVRLLICSIDKAEEIGMNWWRLDPAFGGAEKLPKLQSENRELRQRLGELEDRLNRLSGEPAAGATPSGATPTD